MGLGIKTYGFYRLGLGKKIKSINPQALLKNRILSLESHEGLGEMGGLTMAELAFVSSMALENEGKPIFEIGTFRGVTTHHLALFSKGNVFTLDLPAEKSETKYSVETAERAFIGIPDRERYWVGKGTEPNIISLRGDSASFDYRAYYNRMALVFVDASHAYEYVCEDSRNALKMLGETGCILWHDYAPCWPGVVKALNELSRSLALVHIKGTSIVAHIKNQERKK